MDSFSEIVKIGCNLILKKKPEFTARALYLL